METGAESPLMFGWFKAKCPVGEEDRRWIEYRMAWLAERLGSRRVREGRIILPTNEFFSEPYEESEEDARRLLGRVAKYMDREPWLEGRGHGRLKNLCLPGRWLVPTVADRRRGQFGNPLVTPVS